NEAASAKSEATNAKAAASSAKDDAATAKADASGVKAKITSLDFDLRLTGQQLEEAKRTLAKFDNDTQVKLGEISKDQLLRLDSLKNDRVKFEEEFRKQLTDLG